MACVSVFIAYHLLAVLVHNAPAQGPLRDVQARLESTAFTASYLKGTGTVTSWAVFVPEPPQQNVFVRALVVDAAGAELDQGLEIYGRRRHPYLLYDRLAKVNRQLVPRAHYRPLYAAWLCRGWERTHGEAAREARLFPFSTRIPPPEQAYAAMGYRPAELPLVEAAPEVFPCASTPHAQLPRAQRARRNLPPTGAAFVDIGRTTWWTRGETGRGPRLESAPAPTGGRDLE
jgi:hypothetical protein